MTPTWYLPGCYPSPKNDKNIRKRCVNAGFGTEGSESLPAEAPA
jgi:hypothetical protein